MARYIVVAFRMPPGGMTPGPEGAYLTRARSMCARGEALGGRLVAWSGSLLAMAWDCDSLEEALLLATSVREEARSVGGRPESGGAAPESFERAWSSGMAEGELEPLAPDGARMQLAWGEALLSAASLARIAKSGELLVDGDVTAVRAGQLTLVGSRTATDAGQRVRGWRVDLEHPWRRNVDGPEAADSRGDTTDRYPAWAPEDDSLPLDAIVESSAADGSPSESSESSEALDIVEASAAHTTPSDEKPRLDRAPVASRCQASLALAMTLAMAGRSEDALLEALDALARARGTPDPKAVGACMALLAKLYSRAGLSNEAAVLRESCGA
jgi:hypothetical protein